MTLYNNSFKSQPQTICLLRIYCIKQMITKERNFLIRSVYRMALDRVYLSQRQHYLTIVLKSSSNVMVHNEIMRMLSFLRAHYSERKLQERKSRFARRDKIVLNILFYSFIFCHGAPSNFSHLNSFGRNFFYGCKF